MDATEQVIALLQQRGDAAYFGEEVSQREHALQSALMAQRDGAPDSLVVAALLHDVGHLVHRGPEDLADLGIDARHEEIGARWLSRFFAEEITEPIRLHVAAKRYLCAHDPQYSSSLSEASRQSLRLQGGPFDEEESRRFLRLPYAEEAARLRRWDEAAKVRGLTLPAVASFRALVASGVRRS